jgi:hypothetical protein
LLKDIIPFGSDSGALMRFSRRPRFKAGGRPMHGRTKIPNNQKML